MAKQFWCLWCGDSVGYGLKFCSKEHRLLYNQDVREASADAAGTTLSYCLCCNKPLPSKNLLFCNRACQLGYRAARRKTPHSGRVGRHYGPGGGAMTDAELAAMAQEVEALGVRTVALRRSLSVGQVSGRLWRKGYRFKTASLIRRAR